MTSTLDRKGGSVVKSSKRWLYVVAGLVAVFVTAASVAQAIRQGSWAPVTSVAWLPAVVVAVWPGSGDRKSTRLNSSHMSISYAVFCLKKKKKELTQRTPPRKDGRRPHSRSPRLRGGLVVQPHC